MTETKTQAIQHASMQLMEAWKSNDFDALNELLHKDFQFVSLHIPGYKYNRLQWLEVALNKYKLSHYRYQFLNLTESGNVAVSLSKLSMLSSATFHAQTNQYLVTDLWRYEQNQWKLLLRQPVLFLP